MIETKIKEEWDGLPVIARVALISSLVDETQVSVRKYGSASWEKLPDEIRALVSPALGGVEDTNPNDRTIHAGSSGGKPVYRASMAGHCVKELYLWRTGAGAEFDAGLSTRDEYRDKGYLAANEGNIHEGIIVESLKTEGFEVTNTGEDQPALEARYKRFVVRSHPDGLIRGLELGSTWRVLECKALNQDRFNLWKSMGWSAFPNYAHQVSLEMYLASKKYESPVLALFVVKNRNTGEVIRTLVDRPPVDPASIINKFSAIENLIEAEGQAPGCPPEAEWFFCPFLGKGYCDAVKGKTGEVDVVEDPELEATFREFKGVKAAIKELEDREAALKNLIKEHMVLGPAIKVGTFFAKLSERTRRGFDIPAAKEFIESKGIDPSLFDKETSYTELRVTGGKEDSDTNFTD